MAIDQHIVERIDSSDMAATDRYFVGTKLGVEQPGALAGIASVTIGTAGEYATLPTIVVTTDSGSGATLVPVMNVKTPTIVAAGTGYAAGDAIVPAGGTHTSTALFTVASTKMISAAVNAAGTGYNSAETITLASNGTDSTKPVLTILTTKVVSALKNAVGSGYVPGDLITCSGGTHSVSAILSVTNVGLVAATLNAAGSGYAANDTITVAGGTSSIAAIITVLSVSGGAIATFSVTTAGVYTVASSALTQASTTGGGTGATFSGALYGIGVLAVSNGGAYTVNSTTFTQSSTTGSGVGATIQTVVYGVGTTSATTAGVTTVNGTAFTQFSTSGSGTGATFNTPVYGLNALSIASSPADRGSYTVLPSNPVAQTSTTGSGTGATFAPTWQFLSVTVSVAGDDYSDLDTFSTTGGGVITPATATLVIDNVGVNAVVEVTFDGASLPSAFMVKVNPAQACGWFVDQASYTSDSFEVTFFPIPASSKITAGVPFDVEVSA